MAVTFVTFATHSGNSTTSFSVAIPATQANDIIILEYTHRGTTDATIGGTYTGPAFAEKHDQQYASNAFSGKTLWSRASGNHSAQTVTGASLTNSCAAIVTVYRGALTTGDPLADATVVGEPNASGNETQPEITTTTAGAWVVLVVANSPDVAVTSAACTSPGALANRAEHLSTGGTDTSIVHASAEKASAGATGAFTWAQTDGAGGSWAYAIRPAPANSNSTGDLIAQSAAISGTGVVKRTSTGALAAQSSAIAGTGIVGRTSTGALAVQSSSIAGESTVGRAATGDLLVQSSVIDGSGTVEGAEVNDFPATGDLVAQASTIEGAGLVGRTSTGDLISQSATMTAESTVARVSTGDLISQDAVIDGSGTSSALPEVSEVVERAKAAPRKRYRIIEDPDLLQEELRVEEKKVEVAKKKLRILIKRSESPNVEGVLYQQIQEKIEKLEAKIDDRLEKIAGLMLAIQVGLDEQDDDEEEMLLLS
jgi:hypothetical protein